jgi:WD40 repeat protein
LFQWADKKVLQTWPITEVSALRFHPDGITYAYGTSNGTVKVYDIREVTKVKPNVSIHWSLMVLVLSEPM